MNLDLINGDRLDEDFSYYATVSDGRVNRNRKPRIISVVPSGLPSGDRLEDEFGASANYPRFDDMNDFTEGIPAKVISVGDTDYEYTPYGYTTQKKPVGKVEEYSNFKFLGIGKLSKKQEERRKRAKEIKEGKRDSKIRHSISKFNPAFMTMRTAILSLIRLNVLGIASAFSEMKDTGTDKYGQIKSKWYNWGGSKKSWDKAVSKGRKKKKLFEKLVEGKGKRGFDSSYDLDEFANAAGAGNAKAAKSLLKASSGLGVIAGIIASIPTPSPAMQITGGWVGAGAAGLGALGGIIKTFAKDAGASDKDVADVPENADPPEPPTPPDDQIEKIAKDVVSTDDDGNKVGGEDILGMPATVFYIGVGVIAIVGGYFVYKKFIAKK
jgi:hypothetical protein